VVERGCVAQAAKLLPRKTGKVFVVSTEDVWGLHGARLQAALSGIPHEALFLPGGEENKRLGPLEALAEQMVERGGDRTSAVIAFGGGIVNDMAGFLAAIFMRGIPVLQIPTTLLAQVDAGIGGKTGVNLKAGKNLVGSFHQPLAVLTDPALLDTLPEREFRSGLWEIVKAGIIRDAALFDFLEANRGAVLARETGAVDRIIADVPNASDLKRSILSHHTTAEDAGRVAQAAGVGTLVLSHLVPAEDPTVSDEMWIEAARSHFAGRVILGRDLLEL